MTRSPTENRVTPGPTSTTSPARSSPGMSGGVPGGGGYRPSRWSTSARETPAARTSTSNSPAAGRGWWCSRHSRPPSTMVTACTTRRPLRAVELGADAVADEPDHLTRLGVPPGGHLRVDEVTVHRHLEAALGAGHQLDPLDDGRPPMQQLGRQTDGPVDVVSRDAELDQEPVTRA